MLAYSITEDTQNFAIPEILKLFIPRLPHRLTTFWSLKLERIQKEKYIIMSNYKRQFT